MKDQRHTRRTIEHRHFVPQPALAQHIAMVGSDNNDRVVVHRNRSQRCQQLADFVVDIADCAGVAVARVANMFLGDHKFIDRAHALEPLAVRIELCVGYRRHSRHVDLVVAVAIPILARDHIRVVRLGERH